MLHIGHQREELDIELEGKKLTYGDSFTYLGGAVCGGGKTERGVRRRAQVDRTRGEQMKGDGGPADLKKNKGQDHEHLCDAGMPVGPPKGNLGNDRTETLAMTELQQQRLHVSENNWGFLATKNSKSNEGREAKNVGVKANI